MLLGQKTYKRIVIKIGSSLLVSSSKNTQIGKIRRKWLEIFSGDIAELRQSGIEVIITTSGAVALGREILGFSTKKLSLCEKQAAAAAGQIELMSSYQKFFKKYDLKVAQILLTASDCNSRQRYLNCKNTINTLLQNHIIPIINENDSVAVDEIKIGDNDRLASRVAQMISADLLVLFSDIDGLFDKNPKLHKDATLIKEVPKITREIEKMAQGTISNIGTGGMATKIIAAKMASGCGCETIITNGFENRAVHKLFFEEKEFTIFLSDNLSQSSKHISKARKNWLSGLVNAKGEIVINQKAATTLRQKKVSLLPIGALAIKGNFMKGDGILVIDEGGNLVASGISNHDSQDIKKILQKNSTEVKKILGKDVRVELIHVDNLIVATF